MRQVIGDKGDKPGQGVVTQFCILLANGRAPRALRPYLGGANGFAAKKEAKAEENGSTKALGASYAYGFDIAMGTAWPHSGGCKRAQDMPLRLSACVVSG